MCFRVPLIHLSTSGVHDAICERPSRARTRRPWSRYVSSTAHPRALRQADRHTADVVHEALDSTTQTLAGRRRDFDVIVVGGGTVFLTNLQAGERTRTTTFHNTDGERGRAPGFIGLQAYSGNTVAWRHLRIKTA
jgi:hypothetical protein